MKIRDILLENLVLETPEEVRSEIIQKISKIQDEPDLINVLKFTKQYAYKKDVGKLSTVKGFKDSVSNIILQAVGNVDAPDTLIRAFLKRLSTDGVIKENLLLTPGMVHVMDDIVDMKFRGIFNAIKLDLFEKIFFEVLFLTLFFLKFLLFLYKEKTGEISTERLTPITL